jgi:hypothetical protein
MAEKTRFTTKVARLLESLVQNAAYGTRRTKRLIVVPDARPRTAEPIFIVGVHRSGTTLLRLILDSHPRIGCPPESFFLLPLRRLLDDEESLRGLAAMGFPREQVARRLGEFASWFFEMYAASHGKARWADKTPSYVDCLGFIEAAFDARPRYLLIYRHGLDAACSIAQIPSIHEADPHTTACGGDRHAGSARYWATQCARMREFAAAHPERCLELRYEALSTAPEAEVRRVLDFLGEPWDPAVLRFHQHAHDHDAGLEDRKATLARGFEPNSGAWRDQPRAVIEAMYAQAAPMLLELGYRDVAEFLARTAP